MARKRIQVRDEGGDPAPPDARDEVLNREPEKPAKRRRASASSEDTAISVKPLEMRQVALCILGASPLIFNRMSAKAQRELLLPAAPKNRASRRASLKHDPVVEFRDSVHVDRDPTAPTRLVLPATCFKASVMTAALETPGATKAQIGRLLQVVGYSIRVWGIPQMFMCGVRQAGINRTPDIRTRALLPEWATLIKVRYPVNTIEPASVGNMFAAAGQICGVGDFRQERGKGSFGLFSLVNEDDEDYQRIIATGGAAAQDEALRNPKAFNSETADLWTWFESEIMSRGRGEELNRGIEAQ